MTRSEAITHLARADLAHVPPDERAMTLERMCSQGWDEDPEWAALPPDVRAEIASGRLHEAPSSSRYDAALMLPLAHRYRGATNEYVTRRLSQLGIAHAPIAGEPALMEPCPCCGLRTLDSRGRADICLVCWWEDDGQDDPDAERAGGPNGPLALSRARANFLVHGISDPAREDLRPHQQPADMFARARRFVLIDLDDRSLAVEDPATGWRSLPLQPSTDPVSETLERSRG